MKYWAQDLTAPKPVSQRIKKLVRDVHCPTSSHTTLTARLTWSPLGDGSRAWWRQLYLPYILPSPVPIKDLQLSLYQPVHTCE